jgi:predicted RNA-binding protein with TRAM domain
MKKINILYKTLLVLLFFSACKDVNDLDFLESIPVPTNISASYDVTQDNTGVVTITPVAEGANSFKVYFGDATTTPADVKVGESIQHTYAEGTYTVKIEAFNIKGEKAEQSQELVVSFKAPQNLVATIENDAGISKQVNITATADFATMFEFHSGETGVNQPAATANIGETINYVYTTAGDYDVKVIAKGAAIATTEHTETFKVTEILQPLASAPTPPNRSSADVISIYSSAYTDVADTNYFPDWNQGSQGSSWAEFDLNGDKMLQYINLSYQGIALKDGTTIDVSGMEFLHMDVWTSGDATDLETSLINNASGTTSEKPVTKSLTAGQWTSIEIPIKDYTDQGLTVTEIFQMKFVGTPWAGGTVFIDNIYFYKSPSTANTVAPIDFETPYSLSSFDGGDISVVANPHTTGNSSSMVAQMVKNAGQPWAGSKITLSQPFSFAGSEVVKMKVWSPRAGLNLLMKFEDDVPWPNVSASADVVATTTVANGWEELTFDFTGITNSGLDFYNMVLIMDNGTQGDGSANYTIFIDDITTSPALDFEPKFSLSSFDGGDISVVANPHTTGNSSSMVAQMVKNAGQPWAGSKITVPTPFSFVGQTKVKMKVWSPRAGINLLMKFEDDVPWPNVTASADVIATTTVANGWEELTFDFTGINTSIDFYNMVLIMDNGTQGDGSANYTIFLDDITQF